MLKVKGVPNDYVDGIRTLTRVTRYFLLTGLASPHGRESNLVPLNDFGHKLTTR